MSSLLENWPYKCVPSLPNMDFADGDRVQHFLGQTGAIKGYDLFNPAYWYVQFDSEKIPSRIPASSLEKVDE